MKGRQLRNQQGAALLIVLALLSSSLMLGLSSMQSATIGERLSGNYRASVQATMVAETLLSGLADYSNEGSRNEFLDAIVSGEIEDGRYHIFDNEVIRNSFPVRDFLVKGMLPADFEDMGKEEQEDVIDKLLKNIKDDTEIEVSLDEESRTIWVAACDMGLRGSSKRCAAVVYEYQESGGNAVFKDTLIGCDSVMVANGGSVLGGGVRTLTPDADVSLTGGTYVEGDIEATGKVYTQGSSAAGGDIRANGDIVIDAAAEYAGSISTMENVVFNNTAKVVGSVLANGNVEFNNGASVSGNVYSGGDVYFRNTGAYVEGSVNTAGKIINDFSGWKDARSFVGGEVTRNPHSGNEPVISEACDAIDLPSVIDDFDMISNGDVTVGNWPLVNGTITPNGITSFDKTWDVQRDVTLAKASMAEVPSFDGQVPVIRTADLKLTNGELNVTGGDVVLFVDGNLTLGSGGGPGLTIAEGSTLTIFLTGNANVKSSTQMAGLSVLTNERPTFSLFSSKIDDEYESGVKIDGNAKAMASIYAPYANVSVEAGGGLKGSVRGKTISVTGGAGIFYEPGLMDFGIGEGSDEELTEVKYKIVRWLETFASKS